MQMDEVWDDGVVWEGMRGTMIDVQIRWAHARSPLPELRPSIQLHPVTYWFFGRTNPAVDGYNILTA